MVNLIRAAERGLRRRASSLIRGAEAAEADVEMALHPFRQVAGELEGLAEEAGAAVAEEIGGWVGAGRLLAGAADVVAPELVAGTAVAAYGAKRLYDMVERTVKKRKKNSGASESTARQPQEPGSRRTPRRHGPADKPKPPMPPKGVSTATHWYDRTRKKWVKRKRPLKKRPSMRKKAYKKRTTRTKRTYKRKKVVKRKFMRSTGSSKYGVHGIIHRHEVSYFGFQSCGGRDEFLHAASDAVLRAWAGKFHVSITHAGAPWNTGSATDMPRAYKMYFRKFDTNIRGEYTTVTGGLSRNLTDNHAVLCDTMTKDLAEQAENGYIPYYCILYSNDAYTQELYRDNKFGDMLINVTSTMQIKLRNVTKPDNETGDLAATQKNPLMGYAYEFSGDTPLVKDVLIDSNSSGITRFMHRDNDRGVCLGPQNSGSNVTAPTEGRNDGDGLYGTVMSPNTGPFASNGYLGTPPAGSTVWKNCRKSHKIILPVGREVKHTLKCAYKGTLTGLMQKYNAERYRLASIGSSFWLGLRQKFRNSTTISHTGVTDDGHDHVTVEYDVDTVIRSAARIVRPELTPAEVNHMEINSIAAGE